MSASLPLEALGWDAGWASVFEQLENDNLIPARVAAQHRGAYVVWSEDGELRARAAGRIFYEHEVGGAIPAVGDWVAVTRSEQAATIAAVLPRRSAFIRKRAGFGSDEQVLAANVDAAFLLAGLDDDFSLRRLERYSRIGNQGVALRVREGEDLAVTFHYVGVARLSDRHQIESFLTLLVRLSRQLTNRRLLPSRVSLCHRRKEGRPELDTFLGCAFFLTSGA